MSEIIELVSVSGLMFGDRYTRPRQWQEATVSLCHFTMLLLQWGFGNWQEDGGQCWCVPSVLILKHKPNATASAEQVLHSLYKPHYQCSEYSIIVIHLLMFLPDGQTGSFIFFSL